MDKMTIAVNPEIAEAYNRLPEEEQLKIQAVMSAWMNETGRIGTEQLIRIVSMIAEIRSRETDSVADAGDAKDRLLATMDRIADRAAERGLTPEILEELLADES